MLKYKVINVQWCSLLWGLLARSCMSTCFPSSFLICILEWTFCDSINKQKYIFNALAQNIKAAVPRNMAYQILPKVIQKL
jgi:hypothetical protein